MNALHTPPGMHPLHNRIERIAVLRRLRDERIPLTCVLLDAAGEPTGDQLYHTMITAVDVQADQLQIMPIDSVAGRAALRKSAMLRCVGQLGREAIQFTSNWLKNVGLLNTRHVLALPRMIYSSELRQAKRMEVPGTIFSKLELHASQKLIARGTVNDLSIGGVAGVVTAVDELDYLLSPGTELESCTLVIKDYLQVPACRLKLRMVRWRRQRDYLVGGEFEGLPQRVQREVELTVARLEREQLARTAQLREEEKRRQSREA